MSIQSSKYFNRKFATKLLWQHIYSFNINVNMSTKHKTHYDALEILPNATYNEIKSAYYKLTLKYHPDRNKSDSAKQIFQEITTAYEVLSNHKLRKQYDRSIIIKYGSVNEIQRPAKLDNNVIKNEVFDFDKWTYNHYGCQREQTLKRKKLFKEFLAYQEQQRKEAKEVNSSIMWSLSIICTIVTIVLLLAYKDKDIPLNKKQD